jgi:hypothetical protein
MHTKGSKSWTPLHLHIAYLSGFKRGWSRTAGEQGVCNLIYRSLLHYYGDYSTSTFLLYILPSLYVLPSLSVLPLSLYASFPLCASSIYFLSILLF